MIKNILIKTNIDIDYTSIKLEEYNLFQLSEIFNNINHELYILENQLEISKLYKEYIFNDMLINRQELLINIKYKLEDYLIDNSYKLYFDLIDSNTWNILNISKEHILNICKVINDNVDFFVTISLLEPSNIDLSNEIYKNIISELTFFKYKENIQDKILYLKCICKIIDGLTLLSSFK
jgi:hypothetical protein